MAGGEIEFRDRLQPEPSDEFQFFPEFLRAPRASNGNLRVAFVSDPVAEIYNHHIQAIFNHFSQDVAPERLIEAEIRPCGCVTVGSFRIFAVSPHVVAEVEKIGFDQF
ncbi:MAG: hypothetical protein BWY06_02855 [Candidatus Latescibacteria bacterium ADurb.Bin168]|nr:MAG: hypothetical protein BWY06_02855 [Candidatus Latescibacteria bacterium ADurb.Bin168]